MKPPPHSQKSASIQFNVSKSVRPKQPQDDVKAKGALVMRAIYAGGAQRSECARETLLLLQKREREREEFEWRKVGIALITLFTGFLFPLRSSGKCLNSTRMRRKKVDVYKKHTYIYIVSLSPLYRSSAARENVNFCVDNTTPLTPLCL